MAKTRQKLLIMAMAGLVLSSFSLLTVQGTLSGLQGNRIERSKSIEGSYIIRKTLDENSELVSYIENEKIPFSLEYLIEGILKKGGHVIPARIHGIDPRFNLPPFLKKLSSRDGIYMSAYMGDKALLYTYDQVQLISPTHTNAFFGDIPRHKTLRVGEFINTSEPSLDEFDAWTHIRNIQSIIRKKSTNTIRIFSVIDDRTLKKIESRFDVEIISWEREHANLVYALSLENSIMLLLFMGTVVLVVLTIISGLSIFYNRIRKDFAAFWILGMSLENIKRLGVTNIILFTIVSLFLGNSLGLGFLLLLKKYSPQIMPDMFVDRSLPINITASSFIYSFLVPLVITVVFSKLYNSRFFKNKDEFVQLIRSVGR